MKNCHRLLNYLIFLFLSFSIFAQFQIENAFSNLSFIRPVDLQNAGDGSNRIFVVEQRGVISVFENDANVPSKTTFLNIESRVDDSSNEEGLLGLAFHPDYKNNGFFYVNYTATGPNRTVISRFTVSTGDSNVADPASEFVIIELDKPASNHNAGAIAFGPNDGFLYITAGDGGGSGDTFGNGQNLQTLLGTILRIDVDNQDAGLNYAIPSDNPFVDNGQGFREEIFAYGMRNPWRISFDPLTGWLWCGDVGQFQFEEIDVIESGKNYGWNIMEGFNCFDPPNNCDMTGLELPVWEYSHALGSSVTGGYVYRGPSVPELLGLYIYADFGSGRIWSLEYDGENPAINTPLIDTPQNISSFGIAENQELYICSFSGSIFRFTPTTVAAAFGAGWNIVGLPTNAADPSVSTVFPTSMPGTLFSFNGGYVPESVLTPGTGYWLNFAEADEVTFDGSLVTNVTIDLESGWNIISGPACPVAVADIIDPDVIIEQGTIFGFSAIGGGYSQANTLLPGSGYWVRASAAGQITLDCAATQQSVKRSQQLFDLSNFPSFEIQDNAGASRVLYYNVNLDDNISKTRFSLPPIPFAGIFDARFTGDYRISESDDVTIQLQTSYYPLSLTPLNLPPGKNGQYSIKTFAGNELVSEHSLHEGESIEIRNPQVNMLKLSQSELVVPVEFIVAQNYPNPFNPMTNIEFQISDFGFVELKIYDTTGRLVKKLIAENKEAGFHTVTWDGTDDSGGPVASGVYFYRLEAKSASQTFLQTRKMMLMK